MPLRGGCTPTADGVGPHRPHLSFCSEQFGLEQRTLGIASVRQGTKQFIALNGSGPARPDRLRQDNNNYTNEHQHTPQLTLDNTAIIHKHSTKIFGVTYDTSLSSKDIHDIKQKCTHRLNTLHTLTSTDFGQHKETITLIYKQYICSVLEYASPAELRSIRGTEEQQEQQQLNLHQ